MVERNDSATGLRAVARDAVRQQLSEVAIDLFDEHGFDQVTVDQVATVAGISTRSVHRYFASKEDLVVAPFAAFGESVRRSLEARPVDELPVQALHAAYAAMLQDRPQTARDKKAIALLSSTSSLRARNVEKHLQWAELLEPVLMKRLAGEDAPLRARVLVQASIAVFTVALTTWADSEGADLPDLLDTAFTALLHP